MKKIDRVVVTNFKKFDQLAIELKGRHMMLVGSNGAGKSTIIDAIKRTLGLKGKLLEEPVRQGEEKASIKTYVMDNKDRYCLEERFTRGKKGRIAFYKVNGTHEDELNPPLERFQQIFGRPIDFTPLLSMDGEKQFDYLKENLGVDVSTYEHNYEAIYEDRTQVGRDLNAVKAQLSDPRLQVYDTEINEYDQPKTVDSILGQKVDLEPIMKKISEAETRKEKRSAVAGKLTELDKEIERLRQQILMLQGTKKDCEEWLEKWPELETEQAQKELAEAKKFNEEIDQQLLGVSEWNEKCRKVQAHLANKKLLEEKQKKYDDLTARLRDLDGELNKALTNINLEGIVPGLKLIYEVGPDPKNAAKTKILRSGLEFEGMPFNTEQHSYGKCLKVIIKLAAHFNADKLNFIPITNWNLLDDDGKQEILDLAKDNPDLNIQFAIEKVDNNKQIITEIIEA